MEGELTEIWTLDTARILNQQNNEWEEGYQTVFKRHKTINLWTNFQLTGGTFFYSDKIYYKPFSKHMIFAKIIGQTVGGGVRIRRQVSWNGSDWYTLDGGSAPALTVGNFVGSVWQDAKAAPASRTVEDAGADVIETEYLRLIADTIDYAGADGKLTVYVTVSG